MIVAVPDTGITPGSGLGDLCVQTQGEEDECVFTVDGQSVTPDEDASDLCPDGALLTGLPAKTSTVTAVCGEASGSLTTGVIEDTLTTVTVIVAVPDTPVTPTVTTGSVCITVRDELGNPNGGCALHWPDLLPADQPVAGTAPSGVNCASVGQYYFDGLTADEYTVDATCANASGSVEVVVTAGQHGGYDLFTYSNVNNGDICSVDHAFLVDAYDVGPIPGTPTLNLAIQLGRGDSNGGCDIASVTDKSDLTVVSLSGPGCASLGAPGCRLAPAGDVGDPDIGGVPAHLLWTADMSGMDPSELIIYQMGIEDSATSQSLTRAVWVYNGNAADL